MDIERCQTQEGVNARRRVDGIPSHADSCYSRQTCWQHENMPRFLPPSRRSWRRSSRERLQDETGGHFSLLVVGARFRDRVGDRRGWNGGRVNSFLQIRGAVVNAIWTVLTAVSEVFPAALLFVVWALSHRRVRKRAGVPRTYCSSIPPAVCWVPSVLCFAASGSVVDCCWRC